MSELDRRGNRRCNSNEQFVFYRDMLKHQACSSTLKSHAAVTPDRPMGFQCRKPLRRFLPPKALELEKGLKRRPDSEEGLVAYVG